MRRPQFSDHRAACLRSCFSWVLLPSQCLEPLSGLMRKDTAKAVGLLSKAALKDDLRCGRCHVATKRPLDSRLKLIQLDRFGEMLGKAGMQTSFDIAVMAETADRDSRNLRDCAQLHHQFHSRSIRKGDIAN